MKLVAIQMTSSPDIDENLAFIEQQVSSITISSDTLVVIPECCLVFGCSDKDIAKVSEPLGKGKMQTALAEIAKKNKVNLLAGTIPIAAQHKPYSASSLLFNEQGECVAHYQKIHLFDVDVDDGTKSYRESNFTQAGEQIVVHEVNNVGVGLSVCYDARFPELYRQLRGLGADVLCVPAAFTVPTGKAHWEALLRARAIENQCYVIAAGQTGVHANGRETYGHSMIIDPWGEVIANAGSKERVISAIMDMAKLAEVRKNMPVWDHRRIK